MYEEGDRRFDGVPHDIDEPTRGGLDSVQEQEVPKSPIRREVEGIGFPMRYLTVIEGLSPC
jgi:hypothetical protein